MPLLTRTELRLAGILSALVGISWVLVLLPLPHAVLMLRIFCFLNAFLFLLLLALFGTFLMRIKRRKRYAMREALSNTEIYKLYAGASLPRTNVLVCWNHISEVLSIPAGLLRPDDTLNDLCGWDRLGNWDAWRYTAASSISDLVEDATRFEGAPEPGRLVTLDDLVRYLAPHWKVKAK